MSSLRRPIWSSYEVEAATGGALLKGEDWSVAGFSIDTRSLQPGDMFVALKAARDGHEFLATAAQNGAAVALVSETTRPRPSPDDFPLVKVDDVLPALEQLARAARDRCFGKLIAVTGSAGKTSTKEMLRYALASSGHVHAAEKSFNNHIGVPLTLASLPANTDYGVFEIGMNHSGEIIPLVDMVKPHVAIITTVAAAHLENLGSMEAIAAAKAEIFTGLRDGGVAILPADNPHYDYLCEQAKVCQVARILPFGECDAASDGFQLLSFEIEAAGAQVAFAAHGQRHTFTLASQGKHQAMNALAALAAATQCGVDIERAIAGLENFVPGDGRGAIQKLVINGFAVTVLDESYNANPASMAAAFGILSSLEGRRIAVLGDMKELGPTSADLHASLAEPLLAARVDTVFTAGTDITALREKLPSEVLGVHAENAIDLLDDVLGELTEGDVLLFKGSNASQVGKLVAALLEKANG